LAADDQGANARVVHLERERGVLEGARAQRARAGLGPNGGAVLIPDVDGGLGSGLVDLQDDVDLTSAPGGG
jgi:hypothetical protein